MHSICIIGTGPAGISASIYLKRSNKDVIVIGKKESNLLKSEKIENYYGFENGISGNDLYQNGIQQAIHLGVPILFDEVLSIDSYENHFFIQGKKESIECETLILAIGEEKKSLKIPGIQEYEGKGVSYCAVCDGFFYRKKDVIVIGDGAFAEHEKDYLCQMCSHVEMISPSKVSKILGDDFVTGIELKDQSILKASGIFIALGSAGKENFANNLGLILNNKKKIQVNEQYETNVKNVYAIGDAIDGYPQIVKAVYDGMMVALAIIKK